MKVADGILRHQVAIGLARTRTTLSAMHGVRNHIRLANPINIISLWPRQIACSTSRKEDTAIGGFKHQQHTEKVVPWSAGTCVSHGSTTFRRRAVPRAESRSHFTMDLNQNAASSCTVVLWCSSSFGHDDFMLSSPNITLV